MLFHAKLPKFFWVEAFLTAMFLINRLPSQAIAMESPFYRLFSRHPDYSILKVFGCRCFPYLKDRASTKFEPKSYPCIFIGYSSIHKGFRCFHPPSRKAYISGGKCIYPDMLFSMNIHFHMLILSLYLALRRITVL